MEDVGEESASIRYGTAEDVRSAIERLTDVDHLRLLKAARICIPGSAYANPRELVDDALSTPFLAAAGERGRHWPKHVDFIAFLVMTIKGLASDSRKSAVRRLTSSLVATDRDGVEVNRLDSLKFASPSLEHASIDEEELEESGAECETMLAEVERVCAKDPQIGWIVKGIRDGMSA